MVIFVSQGSFCKLRQVEKINKAVFVGIASRSIRNWPSGGASFYGPAESS